MHTIFDIRTNQEAVVVIDDVLQMLKLRRARPDATGARVAAIGYIQDKLEVERREITEHLSKDEAPTQEVAW